jgi:hypothetical protein
MRGFAARKNDDDTVEPINAKQPSYAKAPKSKEQKQLSNDAYKSQYDSRPRLSHAGVKIKPRSINYFGEGVAITFEVVPAQYKNIDGN